MGGNLQDFGDNSILISKQQCMVCHNNLYTETSSWLIVIQIVLVGQTWLQPSFGGLIMAIKHHWALD